VTLFSSYPVFTAKILNVEDSNL